MRPVLLVTLLGLFAFAERAHAQPYTPRADAGAARGDTVITELRDPAGAEFLSGAATAGAWALLLTADGNNAFHFASVAVLLAPALGHAYAGNTRRAARGIGLRAGIAAAGYAALVGTTDTGDWGTVGMVALAVGSGIVVQSALDVGAARASARAYKPAPRDARVGRAGVRAGARGRRRARRAVLSALVTPTVFAAATRCNPASPMRLLVLLLLLAAPAALARPVIAEAEIIAVRGDTVVVRMKSPGAALAYSFLPTAAGLLLLSSGAFVRNGSDDAASLGLILLFAGPSAGHFYARNDRVALRGLALRAVGAVVAVRGAILVIDADFSADNLGNLGAGLVVGGALVYLGSTLHDVASARRSARRFNERAGRAHVSFAPVVAPRQGVGAHLAVRF